MSTSYNAQIINSEGKYKIQFETDNYDYFKMVERACQKVIDKKDKAILKNNGPAIFHNDNVSFDLKGKCEQK